jgi:hypothetical protein
VKGEERKLGRQIRNHWAEMSGKLFVRKGGVVEANIWSISDPIAPCTEAPFAFAPHAPSQFRDSALCDMGTIQ